MPTLILASTSPYRRALLARLGLPFEVVRPEVAEDHLVGESPPDRALRLSLAKAHAVARQFPDAIVIGSDQVAALGDRILDKPGNAANCHAQLTQLSGRIAHFFTGCAVVASGADTRIPGSAAHVDKTSVVFRVLEEAEIARYVKAEQPFDCAGGFKVEALGIALFERVETADPTALIGLPLIWLAKALRLAGFKTP